jgi:hypothetical protein
LQDSHSKMMRFHLDPLGTRQPHLYDVMVETKKKAWGSAVGTWSEEGMASQTGRIGASLGTTWDG